MKFKTKIKIKIGFTIVTLLLLESLNMVSAWWDFSTDLWPWAITQRFQKQEWTHSLIFRQPYQVWWGSTAATVYYYGSKVYNYDTQAPICGWVELYEYSEATWTADLTKPLVLGEWTNSKVMAKIECDDGFWSGCKDPFHIVPTWYGLDPGTTFEDNTFNQVWPWPSIGNKWPCVWDLDWKLILVDRVLPEISDLKMWAESFSLDLPDPKKRVKANSNFTQFSFTIADRKIPWNGVSWIKSYNFDLKFLEDHKWISINTSICSKSETYPEFNPLTAWTVDDDEDIKNIAFACDTRYPNNEYKITKIWKYELTLTIDDFGGNTKNITRIFYIYPKALSVADSDISLIWSTWIEFANNVWTYRYDIVLRDKYKNPIYNKQIVSIDQSIKNYTWWKTLLKNMVLNDGLSHILGQDALTEEYSWNTDLDWKFSFTLKSITPWEFTQRFKVIINKWKGDYNNVLPIEKVESYLSTIWNNTFKIPFIWDLKVSDDDGVTWIGKPDIGTSKRYKFTLTDIGTTGILTPNLNISASSFSFLSGHVWEGYTDHGNYEFSLRINANSNALSAPSINVDNLEIYYDFWVNNQSHYILDPFGIWWDWVNTLWLKVTWIIQSSGEWQATWQTQNFSDLSKAELRKDIRKNAYEYIKSMSHWDILNRVKYVEWNIDLLWNISDYDILIVKDWNVTITGNLNTSWNKLGIVVLKDHYSVNTDYNDKWNIYIKPNVVTITATLYADWGVIAAKSNWLPYIVDSAERTKTLEKQLLIRWFLFTRNTIWWAILWTWNTYTLPGWKVTWDFNKAMIYDLNYVRRWNEWCIDTDWDLICEKPHTFHIDPDESIIPNKIFKK